MVRLSIIILFILVLTASLAVAFSTVPASKESNSLVSIEVDRISAWGDLRIVGNEPFTELILKAENHQAYRVVGSLEAELRRRVPVYIHVGGRLIHRPSRHAAQLIDVENYGFPEINHRNFDYAKSF